MIESPIRFVTIDANHRQQTLAVRLVLERSKRTKRGQCVLRSAVGTVVVEQAVFNTCQRQIGQSGSQAITGALELSTRFRRATAGLFDLPLGLLNRSEQE